MSLPLALAILCAVVVLCALVLKRFDARWAVHRRLSTPIRGNARVNWRRV
jgi:hypothetical protein